MLRLQTDQMNGIRLIGSWRESVLWQGEGGNRWVAIEDSSRNVDKAPEPNPQRLGSVPQGYGCKADFQQNGLSDLLETDALGSADASAQDGGLGVLPLLETVWFTQTIRGIAGRPVRR